MRNIRSLKLLKVDMSKENAYEAFAAEVPHPELFRGECRWTRASEDVVMLYTSDYALLWKWKENARIVVRQVSKRSFCLVVYVSDPRETRELIEQ
jgi:hypothetical protein